MVLVPAARWSRRHLPRRLYRRTAPSRLREAELRVEHRCPGHVDRRDKPTRPSGSARRVRYVRLPKLPRVHDLRPAHRVRGLRHGRSLPQPTRPGPRLAASGRRRAPRQAGRPAARHRAAAAREGCTAFVHTQATGLAAAGWPALARGALGFQPHHLQQIADGVEAGPACQPGEVGGQGRHVTRDGRTAVRLDTVSSIVARHPSRAPFGPASPCNRGYTGAPQSASLKSYISENTSLGCIRA